MPTDHWTLLEETMSDMIKYERNLTKRPDYDIWTKSKATTGLLYFKKILRNFWFLKFEGNFLQHNETEKPLKNVKDSITIIIIIILHRL